MFPLPYNQYMYYEDINATKFVQLMACIAYTLYVYTKMAFWANLSNVCTIPVGGRLNNFKILIGQNFSYGETQRGEIESWNECASFSGK